MSQIVLERVKDPPIDFADLPRSPFSPSSWCLKLYRIRHLASALSADGHNVTCFFEARDAETLRTLIRRFGGPFERLWPATVHAPPSVPATSPLGGHGASLVLVERQFEAPAEIAALEAIEERGASCLDAHRVRFLRGWFANDRRRMLCLYAAPDAEAVRLAQHEAGMPFERASAVRLYEADRGSAT